MTHHDDRDKSGAAAPSRRSVLRATAGAGAIGLAATTLGRVVPGSAARTTGARTSRPEASTADAVIVHVRDVATGEIDVFRGTTQVRVRDRALALEIVRASR